MDEKSSILRINNCEYTNKCLMRKYVFRIHRIVFTLCAADILYEILLHTMFQTIFFCNKVEQKKIGCSNLEKHSDHPELSLKTLLFPYNMKIY